MPIYLIIKQISMPNILITGSKGQLGSEIQHLLHQQTPLQTSTKFYFTDRDTLDITDEKALKDFIEHHNINVIVNCAAYTAVDKAENDEATADKINRKAVKKMAQISIEKGIQLIHISTDYVFDGNAHKPYLETQQTNPQGVYGKTKLEGEHEILRINPPNAIIIRTSWVYSTFGSNFVKTMLKLGKDRDELGVIFDQIGTPTYARDLAETILHIIQHPKLPQPNTSGVQNPVETYNFSNEGVCSWYDFAKAIFELSDIACKVNPIETYQYPTPAKRPHYSLFNKSKIKNHYNITIPYWKDSLKKCLQNMKGRSC